MQAPADQELLGHVGSMWNTQLQGSHSGSARPATDIDDSNIFSLSDIVLEGGLRRWEIGAALQFLQSGPQYQWLLDRIRVFRNHILGKGYLDMQAQLWSAIFRHRKIYMGLDCNLREFLNEQYWPKSSLASVLCLSGGTDCAEAMTIGQYVAAIWPRWGPEILAWVDSPSGPAHSPDGVLCHGMSYMQPAS